ncbi:6-phosphofructokinase [Clostridium sp. CM028]|uniref:6-phosphofructokinase n=1 Tax=unclassified Clostridium TaxID=2614128 RepID=UPI001C0E7668|nr:MULTISPECIES: 6-phosphofructokinase [unclassified Clostridium]MBU3090577.1 6-phosphofructokinase [Clostridium sp. CF011]MBW9144424.1 6-phosphofructokinase [Clostridium sp. CM027]MBW9149340.1 6-phosphofructokinase [Clostridium sp. CM028]UVE40950.1 6-phosphofructokinase [Clostridium sp. CM027]WAG69933.1 6-phosphofructokinase [Clostridium sp. CF011]
MKNCIVAQSGGPTSVINASAIGLLDANINSHYYDNVYAGIYGIQGILDNHIVNLSTINYDDVKGLKYTPSSGLGSCRYKLKPFEKSTEEYIKLFEILEEYEIKTFFYIGGNDSQDTVHKFSVYATEHNKDIKFIGIPKTIDNDLPIMDHTPGFGSAAKLIATQVLENFLDASVYPAKGVFILETMGRDTGWLAASACLATINGKPAADFIYLPEVAFDVEKFLKDVSKKLTEKNHVFVVVSEGIRTKEGKFLGEMGATCLDKFGHVQLGGVCAYLKDLILTTSTAEKVRVLELSTTQRCSMHCASQTDIDEAYEVGKAAAIYSIDGISGNMIGIRRLSNDPYTSATFALDTVHVANNIKYFPLEWINSEGNNVTRDAYEYTLPLIMGEPKISIENGLPKYTFLEESFKF